MVSIHKQLLAFALVMGVCHLMPASLQAQEPDVFDPLYSGTAAQAVEALQFAVDEGGQAEHRFALGIAQTCAAIERVTASLNAYGLNSRMTDNLRMMGIPTVSVVNPAEEMIDAAKFRGLLDRFYQDLAQAQQTLETVEPDGEMKAVFDITRVRLDYNGDGEAGPDEALGRLMQRVQGMQQPRFPGMEEQAPAPEEPEPFPVALDAGDVYWLQGYCHVLMASADFILAHDTDEVFNRTAHMFFAQVDTPYAFLAEGRSNQPDFMSDIFDFVALIHLISLDVDDPERMTDSLDHIRQVSVLSRKSWEAILAETDDDREWIPAPTQASVLGDNLVVDQARLDAWMQFLDEFDAIFAGEKLIPFWRGDKTKPIGVNLAKIFQQPQTFDLILWVQGSAATPYLEEGVLTTPEFWRQLTRAFRGDFMSFAVIVN